MQNIGCDVYKEKIMIIEKLEYRPIKNIVFNEDLSCDIEKTREKINEFYSPEVFEYLQKQHRNGNLKDHISYERIDEYGDIIFGLKRLWRSEKAYKEWYNFEPFKNYKKKLAADSKYEVIEMPPKYVDYSKILRNSKVFKRNDRIQ